MKHTLFVTNIHTLLTSMRTILNPPIGRETHVQLLQNHLPPPPKKKTQHFFVVNNMPWSKNQSTSFESQINVFHFYRAMQILYDKPIADIKPVSTTIISSTNLARKCIVNMI